MSSHFQVAANIIIEDDEILMVKEGIDKARGQWNLPAGGVEPKESLNFAAEREAKEEAGVKVNAVRQIGTYKKYLEEEGNPVAITVFLSKIESGRPETPDSDEILDAKFVDLEKLEDLDLRADYIMKALKDLGKL